MIPNLTTEQRRENLEKAKAARQRRAAILKGVADGSYSVPDVLNMACADDTVARMKVAEGIDMPTYAHEGDAGLDLRITETVTLEPMQKCVVGCGLAVEIPSGCVGLVFPRSGLAAKQGITLSNSVGVIDSGYRGEVCAALINQSYETVTLEAGSRVCQLVVMPYVPCELVPVDKLSDTERGAGGFGSTGVE